MAHDEDAAAEVGKGVAVVTGASLGLGAALAEALAGDGWALVVDARDAAGLAAEVDRLRARAVGAATVVGIAGDVTDPGHRRALAEEVARLGRVDLLVNNASTLGPSPQPALVDYPLDELRRVYEVNVVAPLALRQVLADGLRRAPAPVVLDITSDAAVEAYEGWGGYGSSKAALEQLSAVWAAENRWCRTWALDPGDLRTRMHQEAFPGEDISDRPAPETVVPAILSLLASSRESGRVRVASLLGESGGSGAPGEVAR